MGLSQRAPDPSRGTPTRHGLAVVEQEQRGATTEAGRLRVEQIGEALLVAHEIGVAVGIVNIGLFVAGVGVIATAGAFSLGPGGAVLAPFTAQLIVGGFYFSGIGINALSEQLNRQVSSRIPTLNQIVGPIPGTEKPIFPSINRPREERGLDPE